MKHELKVEVWRRLLAGAPLTELGPGTVDGRLDLRGIHLPDPASEPAGTFGGHVVQKLSGMVELRGIALRALDFTDAHLPSLRLFDCVVENCVFSKATMEDLRVWGSRFSDCQFRGTELRGAVLGAVDGNKRNSFARVDFTRADLRKTVYQSADFLHCDFAKAKLVGVNFGGSVFADCRFAGLLKEVCFNRHGFQLEALPPNEMKGVDFSEAELRWVEFRGLDLDNVRWPEDEKHLIVSNFRESLDSAIAALRTHSAVEFRSLAAGLEVVRKWAGPNQRRGLLNVDDLLEGSNRAAVEVLLAHVQRH